MAVVCFEANRIHLDKDYIHQASGGFPARLLEFSQSKNSKPILKKGPWL